MPSVAPRTAIRAKVLRRTGGRDLVRGCRQRLAFARVLPLPAHRTFFFVVHREPFRKIVFHAPANIAEVAVEFELEFVASAFLS
jgi:hypothetical protein